MNAPVPLSRPVDLPEKLARAEPAQGKDNPASTETPW
jgi:hypothetical protein